MSAPADDRAREVVAIDSAASAQDAVNWVHAQNNTARPYERDVCVHELFERRVRETPDRLALVSDEEQLSYRELNELANRLARHLMSAGARPGTFVAMCSEHRPDAIVALMGILKSGAAYVPVDPGWPAERQCQILRSLDVIGVVTGSAQYRRFFDLQWELPRLRTILCLDVEQCELPPEPFDYESLATLWDLIADESVDDAMAGGFRRTDDGSFFTLDEVRQYQAHVAAITAELVTERSRGLEIGCGSGLHMRTLAPRVAELVGVDPSARAQVKNAEWVATEGLPIELVTAFAHEVAVSVEGAFDLILLASTVQYFPGPAYLRAVLRDAVGLCSPGGHIVLADLLDPELVDHRFGAVVARGKRDRELMLHPSQLGEVLAGIDRITAVDVRMRDAFDNELACRYDVVLTVGSPSAQASGEAAAPPVLATAAALEGIPSDDLGVRATPDDLAYVIFTSGSTGVPKGVMVQHRPVINLVQWVNETFAISPEDRLLLVTSFGFDLSVYDIFGMLAAGGSVRVVGDSELREPRRLLEILRDEPITFWDSAPAALHQVMQLAKPDVGTRRSMPALRLVFLSGDWVPLPLPDLVRAHFPGATVVALGGATEATIWSNYFVVGEVDPAWPSIPYGKPIQNACYYVLDDELTPCPVGVAGDLYIGGECLAAGYANDGELTAQKFIGDPFRPPAGGRMYRTGDRARYLEDGNMQFLGRLDHQVKIRGFRVELGEVEAALARHPQVEVAVVVASPGATGDRQLDSYLVARSAERVVSHELRRHLANLLPAYMIPQTFTWLDALPVSPTGKVDRKALPQRARLAGSGTIARDSLEQLVARAWADVLDVAEVGVDDNFFDLGGHSLAATRVVARIGEARGIQVPLKSVFDNPTVAGFAAAIADAPPAGAEAWPAIVTERERSSFPLSLLQEQMWMLQARLPAGAFNETFRHRLPAGVDSATLRRALDRLVERHESLRTTFPRGDDDVPFQQVVPPSPVELAVTDLTTAPASERPRLFRRLIASETAVPFDRLARPFRVRLARLGDRDELLLTVEHLVVDFTSISILFTELDDLYNALIAGSERELPALEVAYGDFSAWERRWFTGEQARRRRDYWKAKLAGLPLGPALPYDRCPAEPSGATSFVSFVLPPEVHTGLRQLASASRSSLFVLSVATVKIMLALLSGATDIVVGTQMTGRYRREVEGLVGLFTGPALLRTDLSGDPTIATVVQRVGESVRELFDNYPFPYAPLLVDLYPEVHRRGLSPLLAVDPIDVEFFHTEPERWSPGVNIVARPPASRRPTDDEWADYSQPLEFAVYEDGRQMWGRLTYRTDFFDADTAEGLATDFERLLESAGRNWLSRVSSLGALSVARP